MTTRLDVALQSVGLTLSGTHESRNYGRSIHDVCAYAGDAVERRESLQCCNLQVTLMEVRNGKRRHRWQRQ